MKILISSHVLYRKPLEHLLTSMVNASFRRWQDVVIVVGGARRVAMPRQRYSRVVRDNVTVVEVPLNAMDYAGLVVAWHARSHPLVRADAYLNLPVAARVGGNFSRLYSGLARGIRPFELRKARGLGANLCVFGSSLAHLWQGTYSRNFTLAEAARLEDGGWKYAVGAARPIVFWARGNITNLAPRVHVGMKDPYHTGVQQSVEWYPSFDVYRYVSGGNSSGAAKGKSRPASR